MNCKYIETAVGRRHAEDLPAANEPDEPAEVTSAEITSAATDEQHRKKLQPRQLHATQWLLLLLAFKLIFMLVIIIIFFEVYTRF